MKNRIKMIVLGILFVALFAGLMQRTTYVFREKENTAMHDRFMALERDSIDTIFVGTSHQFCSISTDMLDYDYGINSFMMATSGQTLPMSYYAVLEAIEYQHPERIILEVVYCHHDFKTVLPEMTHMFTDGMPLGKIKKLAVNDLAEPEEKLYYFYELGFYHNRWKDLAEVDFRSNLDSERNSFLFDTITPITEIPVIDRTETAPMPETAKEYLDKIIAVCKENNVELVLYVAPYNAVDSSEEAREVLFKSQRIFNGIEEYAMEQGIPFYNLFYEIEEIGFDWTTDFMDTQHCNYAGQEKITRYMVEKGYIM